MSPSFVFLHEFSSRPWLEMYELSPKKNELTNELSPRKNKLMCELSPEINTFIYKYLYLENLIFVDSRTSFHKFETRHLFTFKVPYLKNTIFVSKSFHETVLTNSKRVIFLSYNWVNWPSRNFSFTSTSLLCCLLILMLSLIHI